MRHWLSLLLTFHQGSFTLFWYQESSPEVSNIIFQTPFACRRQGDSVNHTLGMDFRKCKTIDGLPREVRPQKGKPHPHVTLISRGEVRASEDEIRPETAKWGEAWVNSGQTVRWGCVRVRSDQTVWGRFREGEVILESVRWGPNGDREVRVRSY